MQMTRKQHADMAQRLAERAADFTGHPSPGHIQFARLAQVHATLATMPYLHCCDAGED